MANAEKAAAICRVVTLMPCPKDAVALQISPRFASESMFGVS